MTYGMRAALAVLAALGMGVPAQAAGYYYFSLFGSLNAQFRIADPIVQTLPDNGMGFFQVSGSVRYPDTGKQGTISLQFYDESQGGGFDIFQFDHQNLGLPFNNSICCEILFTGTLHDPVIRTGTYYQTDYFEPDWSYTLVISTDRFVSTPPSPPGSAVPEPGMWLMLISGFGLIGLAQRMRRLRPILI